MANKQIENLLKIAKESRETLGIPVRKFKHTEDGAVILNSSNKFDREWYEDDEIFGFYL